MKDVLHVVKKWRRSDQGDGRTIWPLANQVTPLQQCGSSANGVYMNRAVEAQNQKVCWLLGPTTHWSALRVASRRRQCRQSLSAPEQRLSALQRLLLGAAGARSHAARRRQKTLAGMAALRGTAA
jgi:hypothetical protein